MKKYKLIILMFINSLSISIITIFSFYQKYYIEKEKLPQYYLPITVVLGVTIFIIYTPNLFQIKRLKYTFLYFVLFFNLAFYDVISTFTLHLWWWFLFLVQIICLLVLENGIKNLKEFKTFLKEEQKNQELYMQMKQRRKEEKELIKLKKKRDKKYGKVNKF